MWKWSLERSMLHALQQSARTKNLVAGRQVHSLMLLYGIFSTGVLGGDYLIRLYAFSGTLLEANLVFAQTLNPSVYAWYGIISAYSTHLEYAPALSLYHAMLEHDITPNKYIFSCILKACCSIALVYDGMLINHQVIVDGFESDVVVSSTLIDLYAKFELLKEARFTFDQLPHPNVVSYGAIIAGYAHQGHGGLALELFEHMQGSGIHPNRVIFLGILSACGCEQILRHGHCIHDLIIRNGHELDLAVGNTIVDMYSKCGGLKEAHRVFDRLPNRNIVSWGALITGYVEQELNSVALELFEQMQQNGIEPNRVIFLSIVKASGNIGAVDQGYGIHDEIIKCGLASDVVLGGALVNMYASFGDLSKAREVFDGFVEGNIVLWSVMLSGYVQHQQDISALQLFEKMQSLNVQADKFVLTCILKACGGAEAFVEAMLVHDEALRSGLESDAAVGSSLVDAYSKCGFVREAEKVFDKVPEKNEVSWGAMLAGYNQHGKGLLALELFERMLERGEKPDKVQVLCILKACGSIGAGWQGKMIHGLVRKCGIRVDVVLGNSLIDMYAKCGNLEDAYTVFSELHERDIVSWGAMISGYAQHGLFNMVSSFLTAMQCEGVRPNDKIFSSVLSACNHAGLVAEGYHQFMAMVVDHDIVPSQEHVNCMIDLLSRVGYLKEAEKLTHSMPLMPDSTTWTSLLTACRTYGNKELGKYCYEKVAKLSPGVSSGYVAMSNICADAHM